MTKSRRPPDPHDGMVYATDDEVEDLLKFSGVPADDFMRTRLRQYLYKAMVATAMRDARRPGPRLCYERVEAAAQELMAAITDLERREPHYPLYLRPQVKALKEVLPLAVNEVRHGAAPRKSSRPKRHDLTISVFHAAMFWCDYVPGKPTTYPAGPFAKFARRFTEVVVGEAGELEHQLVRIVPLVNDDDPARLREFYFVEVFEGYSRD